MLQSMEKREDVLREALEENEKETERWKAFIEENETAIKNMNMFSKKLSVDVMVPFGKKAFFPGRIIHTNEVLVAHYQDYFSECSVHVATEICKQRIDNAKKRLTEIEGEKDLFQNKLEKPYLDGVLPQSEEREIIEEYDEEKEKIWREQHRQRVKEAKLKEKKDREELLSKCPDKDIFKSLEEDERSISELTDELTELEKDYAKETNDLLNKLISGEVNLPPPKKRIAHNVKPRNVVAPKTENTKLDKDIKIEEFIPKDSSQNAINNNELVNSDNDSDSSCSDIPEEIRIIEEQAGYLPENDKIGFYQYQLQIVGQKIAKRTFANSKELEEKLHLFKVRDCLEELLEDALPIDFDAEPNNVESQVDLEPNLNEPPKRRISFATEDQTLEFQKNETVAQMLPNTTPKDNAPKRDIIRLDEPVLKDCIENSQQEPKEKRKTILEKVEENLKNNNLEDADLVNKIIDSSANRIQTLHINFKHSPALGPRSENKKAEMPRTPAELCNLFSKNENDLTSCSDNNFYIKESDRERAYVDVRSEFLKPTNKVLEDNHSKSILKNKSAVEREKHFTDKEEKPKVILKKQKKPVEDEEYVSAYNKVMGDVIERVTEPDPLPDVKFVDMHAPKKRISRFKQMRSEKK